MKFSKLSKMSVSIAAITIAATILLVAPFLVSASDMWEHPPMMEGHHGTGHLMDGDHGEFFCTASGNNPYISFHLRGNTTMASEFRVKFEALVFFTDVDMDGKYNRSADTETSTLELATLMWTMGNLSYNNGTFNATLSTTAPGNFSLMEIVIHYNNVTAMNISNQLKFDIIIVNMTNAAYSGGNFVALKQQLFIEVDNDGNGTHHFVNGTGDDADSIVVSKTTNQSDADAKFSWVENATINGTDDTHAVKGNGYDDSDSEMEAFVETIYLSFPKFANLTYDPTISVIPAAASTGTQPIPGYDIPILIVQLVVASGIITAMVKRSLSVCKGKNTTT